MTPRQVVVYSYFQWFRSSMDSNNKNDKNLKDFEETKELWERQVFSYNLIMIRPCQ